MKKVPKAVAEAEAALEANAIELAAAKDKVCQLETQRGELFVAVRMAQKDADSVLPQCRMVSINWRSSKPESEGVSMVILRRTPGGMLVVRHVGSSGESEYKFKWIKHAGVFRKYEKGSFFSSGSSELRDVPPEYMPATEKTP